MAKTSGNMLARLALIRILLEEAKYPTSVIDQIIGDLTSYDEQESLPQRLTIREK